MAFTSRQPALTPASTRSMRSREQQPGLRTRLTLSPLRNPAQLPTHFDLDLLIWSVGCRLPVFAVRAVPDRLAAVLRPVLLLTLPYLSAGCNAETAPGNLPRNS